MNSMRSQSFTTEELSINWTVLGKPSQGLGRRWGEVREFTSRTRGGSRPAPENLSRRVYLWTRLEFEAALLDQFVLVRGVVAGADQRARLDVGEAHGESLTLELLELVGRDVAFDRQMLPRWPQVLSQGQDLDAGRAQVAHDGAHLIEAFAEPQHEAALGQRAPRARVGQHQQRAIDIGLHAHLARQAGHGFEVVS